jgi:hypothetical protein
MSDRLGRLNSMMLGSAIALVLGAAPLAFDWGAFRFDSGFAKADDSGGDGGGADAGGESDGGADAGGGSDGGPDSGSVGDGGENAGGGSDGGADAGGGSDGGTDAGGGSDGGPEGGGGGDGGADASDASDGGVDAGGEGDGGPEGGGGGDGGADAGDASDGGAEAAGADSVGDSIGNATDSADDSIGNTTVADSVGDSTADTTSDVADGLESSDDTTGLDSDEISDVATTSDGDIDSQIPDAREISTMNRVAVTVIVREVGKTRWNPERDNREADKKYRVPIGSRKSLSTSVAAIEPSAGSPSCATDNGQDESIETSCLVAGFENGGGNRQLAYASPNAPVYEQSPRVSSDPGLYDEIYGLQQVEARRYADRGVSILIVQGIVSNMSNGQRSVPPLLAIVQDDQGKELLRWTFRAEAESLGPRASTGFRSEMFDPRSASAKVTVVFAPEHQMMQ